MRWTLIFAITMALVACSNSDDRTKPIQQEKAADVKTEAAGEHFQNGMAQPDKLMQQMQQTTKPETTAKP